MMPTSEVFESQKGLTEYNSEKNDALIVLLIDWSVKQPKVVVGPRHMCVL